MSYFCLNFNLASQHRQHYSYLCLLLLVFIVSIPYNFMICWRELFVWLELGNFAVRIFVYGKKQTDEAATGYYNCNCNNYVCLFRVCRVAISKCWEGCVQLLTTGGRFVISFRNLLVFMRFFVVFCEVSIFHVNFSHCEICITF